MGWRVRIYIYNENTRRGGRGEGMEGGRNSEIPGIKGGERERERSGVEGDRESVMSSTGFSRGREELVGIGRVPEGRVSLLPNEVPPPPGNRKTACAVRVARESL